jgi:sialic acid synthase SpsE
MSAITLKTELKELIERERDLSILKAIKVLLKKTTLDTVLRKKLTQRAIRSEEDIKKGRVLSRADIIRQTDKLIKK